MRVVIDGRMILPHMTGVGRYILDLIPALLEESPVIDLEIWAQHRLPSDHPVWSLSGERCKLKKVFASEMGLSGHWRLPVELTRSKPDLFHCPHFNLPWTVPGKVVSTIHDLKYIANPEFFPRLGQVKRQAMRMMMKYTSWRSESIIVVSKKTAQDVCLHLGVSDSKIRVIPHGVDGRFFKRCSDQQRRELRDKYQLTQPYILFVGERRPHKNITGLIQAFHIFSSQSPTSYQLVIAGKKYADYQHPEKITAEMGLANRVIFIDDLPDTDLPALYQAADAFVTLSHYEGFGLPLLEAMASGIPVIASETTSLGEVAGEVALLVSPDDLGQAATAIRQAATDRDLREKYIRLGLERARQFTWKECAARTLAVYQEAVNQKI